MMHMDWAFIHAITLILMIVMLPVVLWSTGFGSPLRPRRWIAASILILVAVPFLLELIPRKQYFPFWQLAIPLLCIATLCTFAQTRATLAVSAAAYAATGAALILHAISPPSGYRPVDWDPVHNSTPLVTAMNIRGLRAADNITTTLQPGWLDQPGVATPALSTEERERLCRPALRVRWYTPLASFAEIDPTCEWSVRTNGGLLDSAVLEYRSRARRPQQSPVPFFLQP